MAEKSVRTNALSSAADGLHPFLSRLQKHVADLTPVQKKIADFLLAHPDEAVYLSTTDCARELDVSEASVVRFARALGFGGYREFQAAFREYVHATTSRVSRVKHVAGRRRPLTKIIDEVFVNDIRNLESSRQAADYDLIIEVAEVLWRANAIYIVGIRSAHSLAVFLHFALRLIGRESHLVVPGIGDLPERLVEVERGDVVVGISFERYAKQAVDLFQACVNRGATGIAITDKATSPLVANARHALMCRTNYLTFIDSYVAPLSLLNAILTVMAVRYRRTALRALKRMEDVWRDTDTY